MIQGSCCRSRKGAWIEIQARFPTYGRCRVAPARERGLKCRYLDYHDNSKSRSRKGAWIEITNAIWQRNSPVCRSRKGAWIEITGVC